MVTTDSGVYFELDRTKGNYTSETDSRTYEFQHTFKASGTYQIDTYVMDMRNGGQVEILKYRVEFTIEDPDYPSIDQKVEEIYQACMAACPGGSEYDQALFYHDWIIDNADYDHNYEYAGPSGVLCRGLGTCQSYHDALVLLLRRSGIACEGVTGNGHIWTRVRLDGVWTLIDSTWDDDNTNPYLRHKYFGLTDELMHRAHGDHKTSAEHPCDSLERNYMIRSGEITQISDPIKQQILSLAAGTHTVSASIGNSLWTTDYPYLCPIAAYYLENYDPDLKDSGITVSYDLDSKTYTVTISCTHHSFTSIPGKAPTCTETGLKEGRKCLTCGMVNQEELPALGHTLDTLPGKDPTCTETGLSEGKKCSVCQTVTVPQKELPARGHTLDTIPGKNPTCTEAGLSEGKKCSVCQTVTVPQEELPARGHTFVTIPKTDPTCTEAGLTTGKKCSVCGMVLVSQQTVPARGHTLVTVPAVAPTCTKTGLTAGQKCSVCGTVTVPQKTVPATAHTPVNVPAVAPTCTKTGLTAGQKCSVCGTVTVPQKTVPATAHTPVTDPAVNPSGFNPGLTEGSHCSVCGTVLVVQKEYFSKTAVTLPADGLSGTAFWADGVQLPASSVTEKDGQIRIELSRSDISSLVTYTYNQSSSDPHTVYPVGMKVWMLQYSNGYTAEFIPEFENLLQYAGSSIRITGVKGIRMITGIRQDIKDALTGGGIRGYTLQEYGTVLAWASEVSASSLVLGASGAKSNFAYKRDVADPVFSSGGGMTQYTNVLVGFNNDQCKADIVMRPYIVLRSPDGRDITVYGGVVQRSIGYIAYQNRAVFPSGSAADSYVWDIIHHVYGNQFD